MQKLNGYYYEYFRPGLTCDTIVWSGKKTLIIKRGINPYKGYWALPGGFLDEGEKCKETAIRELKEELELELELEKLRFFDLFDFLDDPRGQSVNLFYSYELDNFETMKTPEAIDVEFVEIEQLKNYLILPHHNYMIRKFHG